MQLQRATRISHLSIVQSFIYSTLPQSQRERITQTQGQPYFKLEDVG